MSLARLRLPFAHEHQLAPPSCPRCGERALIADATQYSDDARSIRHGWVCDGCNYEFKTEHQAAIAS
jgi:transposase-like protein